MDLDAAHADKAIPPLRVSDLYTNITNPTRYEKSLAAPSDEELVGYWWAWASVSFFSGLFVLVVLLGLLSSKHARRQPFNLYLVYLMIPDVILNFLCGISCFLNASNGSYWSHWMCNFQHWYAVWGIGSNCWLNAIITYQIHRLLRYSNTRKRFKMTSNRMITIQSLGVYLYCGFLGTWGLFDSASDFSYGAIQVKGLTCTPSEVDVSSSLFFWLLFMPLFSLIPIFYIAAVSIDIWWRELLPPKGKRRLLAVYFGRIVMVFFAFWGPYFLMSYLVSSWVPPSAFFAGGIFGHLQGPISAGVSLLKPDIFEAVKRFVTCRTFTDPETSTTDSSGYNHSSRIFRFSSVKRSSHDISVGLGGLQRQDQNVSARVLLWPDEDGRYTSGDGDEGPDTLEEVVEGGEESEEVAGQIGSDDVERPAEEEADARKVLEAPVV